MDKHIERAHLLTKYFGIYGYGNFDLSHEELAEVLRLVEKDDEKGLRYLYERLHQLRMG